MCGILGFYRKDSLIDEHYFRNCLDMMKFRGPDDSGVEMLGINLAFGQRRLSIIDLSSNGHQPMFSENGAHAIVFNGEIYNFKKLKIQLEGLGHKFCSNSDTEVILLGYIEWGLSSLLKRLKGMFSFVIYDKCKSQLLGARDRFGMKPFYYFLSDQKFGFSSSLKSLRHLTNEDSTLNHEAIIDYFNYGHIPNPLTVWENHNKLPPAHYFMFDIDKHKLSIDKYWNLETGRIEIPLIEASKKFNELFDQSVQEHLVADVPVGLFLSGGYDSSAILDRMAQYTDNINTFSIGFEGTNRSEHLIAERLADLYKTHHQTLLIKSSDNPMDWMDDLVNYLDEPYAISSMIPYFLISRLASDHNKVVMVGDGGDELLAGYKWHYHIATVERDLWFKNQLRFIRHGGYVNYIAKKYARVMGLPAKTDLAIFKNDIANQIEGKGLRAYKNVFHKTGSMVKDMQWLDLTTFLPEPALTRADRMSMASSLEVRVPFLDHELFEFVFGLNPKSYFDGGTKKLLLAESLKESKASFLLSLPKRGFSFQFMEVFKSKAVQNIIAIEVKKWPSLFKDSYDLSSLSPLMNFKLLVFALWLKKNVS